MTSGRDEVVRLQKLLNDEISVSKRKRVSWLDVPKEHLQF